LGAEIKLNWQDETTKGNGMKYWIALLCLSASQLAVAVTGAPRPEFHRAVYALHEQQIAKYKIRTEERTGEYKGVAADGYRYRITSYYDAATGRLLSRVQRDADRPDAIHSVEVNIYDDKGRVIRDYLSIAPPWRPDWPSDAYVNLHNYNGGLHSWRQFELDGRVSYEFCEGELDGEPVKISLDWTDIDEKGTSSPAYHACFDGMNNDWQSYITPH
jgi:hypothetical protein